MKQKRNIIIVIITILLILLIFLILGNSFGFFKYAKRGETVNIISISGIRTEILSSQTEDSVEGLTLINAYPLSDSEGLKQTPFIFKMTNTSSKTLTYSIIIMEDSEKLASCTYNNSSCLGLTTNKIKTTYKKNNGSYNTPSLLSSNAGVIASGIIEGGEEITSSIILWIDKDAGNEIMNHYFYGKILIQGNQYTGE